jgi:hypothetical protein
MMSKFRVPQAFVVALEAAGLGTKLREPDLALEEARSDLRCCKNPTPERACSCHIGVTVLAPDMAAKVQIR